MKKILFFMLVAVAAIVAVVLNVSKSTCVWNLEVEALAACEITNGRGKVIFKCVGEEGECEGSYLGNTLSCSGKQVDL